MTRKEKSEIIRKELIKVVEEKGVTITFLAKKSGVNRSMLNMFYLGNKNFNTENLNKLDAILKEYN